MSEGKKGEEEGKEEKSSGKETVRIHEENCTTEDSELMTGMA